MNRIRFIGVAALALAAAQTAPAFAQAEVVAQANPDADRLANDIRMLAGDPRDVRTLLDAGMTSARLGDTSAALAFFQRAETISPGDPRIAAGRGMALVRLERPGEALRLFQEAEARGVNPREYASDRGFAYDLLGQPGLAQRDYKLALSAGERDDETLRRYALSLGISGDREDAMRTLEPLLRRSDRASWRARAFILAMNGDTAGAEKIASSMMPGTMGQALSPFFRRLAILGPADRAFAVHFGELSPTQARLADARLAPELPRYVPAPKPVQVAAAQPLPQPVTAGKDRRSRKERERDAKLAAIAAARQPAPAPQPAPDADLPPPPRFVQPAQEIVQPIPAPRREEEPAEVVERKPPPAPVRVAAAPAPVRAAPTPAPAPTRATPTFTPTPTPPAVTLARAEPVVQPVPPRPEPTPPGPVKVGQEDSVLASIVGNITIPADELAAVSAPPPEEPVAEPQPAPVRVAEARPVPAPKPKPEPVAAKPDPKKPDPKAKALAEDPKKAGKPDPKAKAEDARKGAKPDPKAKKPDPKKPDPAKADPSRIWVQVAGGANEDSLAKAWKGVVAKAPAAMKGRSAWTAPLRATNRVLTGPFKTSAEAQAFVNTLGKAGVSGFVFTSEAGQKVTKLAP